jgi:hypothetical protein
VPYHREFRCWWSSSAFKEDNALPPLSFRSVYQ